MALTANIKRPFELGNYETYDAAASVVIYEGAAVGLNTSGYARPLVAGDTFVGFADTKVDNTSGTNGSKNVNVLVEGKAKLPITGVAITDVTKPVYASDDGTFTLTQGSNSAIGRITRQSATDYAIVAFDAAKAGIGGKITLLTDSTGGTPSDTLAAISNTFVQAEIRNAFASLATKLNFVMKQLGNN